MKKIFVAVIGAVLFVGCAVTSPVQNYRFQNDEKLHSFNVLQNGTQTKWTLYIDDAEIISGGFGLLSYNETISGKWNEKPVSMELNYNPGFLGIGRKTTANIFVGGEHVARFEF